MTQEQSPVGRRGVLAVAAVATVLAVAPAAAQVGFFLSTPGIELSAGDRDLLRQTLSGLLDEAEVGEARDWENPDTGTGGTARLTRRETIQEAACGQVDISLRKGERTRSFDLLFCQRPDGTWGIAG